MLFSLIKRGRGNKYLCAEFTSASGVNGNSINVGAVGFSGEPVVDGAGGVFCSSRKSSDFEKNCFKIATVIYLQNNCAYCLVNLVKKVKANLKINN